MKKYKYIFVAIVALLLVSGGLFAYFGNKKLKKNDQKSTQDSQSTTKDKGDNTPEIKTEPLPQGPSKEVTKVENSLPAFTEVSLTIYLNQEEATGPDGKTKIPTGALMPYFYMTSGNFTVQKLANNSWKDILTNVSYPGHGGLWAFYTEPTEDNIQYRVLKVENGKPVSVSKIFVVKRSELSGGYKTYN